MNGLSGRYQFLCRWDTSLSELWKKSAAMSMTSSRVISLPVKDTWFVVVTDVNPYRLKLAQKPDTAIDWDFVVFNGLSIKGIYGREMYETWYKMTVMIQSG